MTPTRANGSGFLTADLPTSQPVSHMVRNASYGNFGTQAEARVLVLYTGGTIGMLRNEKNGENFIRKVISQLFTVWKVVN